MSRSVRPFVYVAILLACVGLAGVIVTSRDKESDEADKQPAYAFAGGEISPATSAPELGLVDQFGNPYRLADRRGKIVLMYFGYTTCPDLCPTTLVDFSTVKAALGPLADGVEFVFVTVDPDRDTQERLRQYLGFFDPAFVGVRGNDEQTSAAEAAYGIFARKVPVESSSTGYLMDHTSLVFVIDQQGRLRLTYPYGTDPTAITTDVQYLLTESP
jgi:protein SCO1/2